MQAGSGLPWAGVAADNHTPRPCDAVPAPGIRPGAADLNFLSRASSAPSTPKSIHVISFLHLWCFWRRPNVVATQHNAATKSGGGFCKSHGGPPLRPAVAAVHDPARRASPQRPLLRPPREEVQEGCVTDFAPFRLFSRGAGQATRRHLERLQRKSLKSSFFFYPPVNLVATTQGMTKAAAEARLAAEGKNQLTPPDETAW